MPKTIRVKSPWCLNSRRWLIFYGWNLKSCPDKERMRNGCVDCSYYSERPLTKYMERKFKISEGI
jgi:hypothetical protein